MRGVPTHKWRRRGRESHQGRPTLLDLIVPYSHTSPLTQHCQSLRCSGNDRGAPTSRLPANINSGSAAVGASILISHLAISAGSLGRAYDAWSYRLIYQVHLNCTSSCYCRGSSNNLAAQW